MSIGTEILSLREDQFSSVAALIGALERLSASNQHLEMRVYAVSERRVSTTLRQVLTKFSEFFICSIRVSSFRKKLRARIA